jgi:hypothetical protein
MGRPAHRDAVGRAGHARDDAADAARHQAARRTEVCCPVRYPVRVPAPPVTGTIHAVLDRLRSESLDERDKGSRFERLIRAYLTSDPEWTSRFSDVWLWSDWPERAVRPDTGIELVAANGDDGGLTAIQCKFYGSDRTVAKADIDSFISAAAHCRFTRRIVFDTAAAWSANAEETLADGVAQRVDIGYLADAAIDWDQFSWTTPEIVVPTGKKALRPHQQRALDDVRAGLADQDRGQLVMACGTGKTFTSLRIARIWSAPTEPCCSWCPASSCCRRACGSGWPTPRWTSRRLRSVPTSGWVGEHRPTTPTSWRST